MNLSDFVRLNCFNFDIQNGDLEEPFEDLFDRQVEQIVKATEKYVV